MNWIDKVICKFKGHKWHVMKINLGSLIETSSNHTKCLRCGKFIVGNQEYFTPYEQLLEQLNKRKQQ